MRETNPPMVFLYYGLMKMAIIRWKGGGRREKKGKEAGTAGDDRYREAKERQGREGATEGLSE